MSVGQDLLDVPFPKMIYDMAMAIAKGQMAMDMTSLKTLQVLAHTTFDYIPEITETLTPRMIPVTVTDASGITHNINITGVDSKLYPDKDSLVSYPLTALQAGINPTFYQFTESIIEVKMSISSRSESSSSLEVGVDVQASGGFLFASASVSSHVNYKTASKYSYSVDGSSLLRTTLKPAPPPPRLQPRFILVNALVSPPKITINE